VTKLGVPQVAVADRVRGRGGPFFPNCHFDGATVKVSEDVLVFHGPNTTQLAVYFMREHTYVKADFLARCVSCALCFLREKQTWQLDPMPQGFPYAAVHTMGDRRFLYLDVSGGKVRVDK